MTQDPFQVPGREPHTARPVGMRVGDAERDAATEHLRQAHAEGRLDAQELEDRVAQALSARTVGDLQALMSDLPAIRGGTAPVLGPTDSRAWAQPATWMRSRWSAWALVVAINLVIWVFVSAAEEELAYFWPLWVAGPWGLVLLFTSLWDRRG